MPSEGALKQAILNGTFSFTARPEPIPGDLRMSWGLAVLLLLLLHSRGQKGSFQKLQFLAHAVRVPEGREDVRALLRGDLRARDISVRVEPWLNRAVAFAHALGFVGVTRGKSVTITDRGKEAALLVDANIAVLLEERNFLREVAPRLTEALLTKIWRMEDLV